MEIITAPNQRLRMKTKPVKKITPSLINTLRGMIKLTKTFTDPEGVGLASTQVGLEGRFFVAKISDKEEEFNIFINPEITFYIKKDRKYFEGCLSVPNYFAEVRRSLKIRVAYKDPASHTIKKDLKGVDAWIFQHEMDHLNGILFVDRAMEQKGRFYKFISKDKAGTDIFEEITL